MSTSSFDGGFADARPCVSADVSDGGRHRAAGGGAATRAYYLGIDLRGNTRFPEAYSVQCVVEWDVRRPLEDLRQIAADFYGVPLGQVGTLRETPLSVYRRASSLDGVHDGPSFTETPGGASRPHHTKGSTG